jgi:DNA-binding transcriptional LysR family regulator
VDRSVGGSDGAVVVAGLSLKARPFPKKRRRHRQTKIIFGSRAACDATFVRMDTRYLQSFVAVVELGSMAEAARHLDLTPAAIAARVKALEEDMGLTLVQRAGRSVRPTAAGLQMLERARTVLREIRDLRAAAGDGAALGELKLGVFGSALTGVLPPLLKRLYGRYPELSVFVAPGNSVELCRQVTLGALDAAIVVEPQFAVGKGCAWQALLEEGLVVVARGPGRPIRPPVAGDGTVHPLRPLGARRPARRSLPARPRPGGAATAGNR